MAKAAWMNHRVHLIASDERDGLGSIKQTQCPLCNTGFNDNETNMAGDTVYFSTTFPCLSLEPSAIQPGACVVVFGFYSLLSLPETFMLRQCLRPLSSSLLSCWEQLGLLGWQEDQDDGWGRLPPPTMTGNQQKYPGFCSNTHRPWRPHAVWNTTLTILANILPVGVAISASSQSKSLNSDDSVQRESCPSLSLNSWFLYSLDMIKQSTLKPHTHTQRGPLRQIMKDLCGAEHRWC